MKLIHLSDLHLGKRVNEVSMIEDQSFILEQILQIVSQESPDGVLIAGDVYDKSVPPGEAVTLLDGFLYRLSRMGIPTVVISGNHDSPERLAFGGRLMLGAGIHVAPVYQGQVEPVTLEDEHGPVDIWLLPFLKPVHVKRVFPDREIGDYTEAMAVAIDAMGIDPNRRNVLVTHQFVLGSSRCESEEVSVGGTDGVDAAVFGGFDYVALGHLHGPQNVGSNKIRYCGTPLKYSFSEADHYKSVTVVELGAKGDLTVRLRPLTPRHDLRQIRGTFRELTEKSFYEGTETGDYLHVILTDEEDVMEAVGRLRQIYPNIMKLSYDNVRTRAESFVDGAREVQRKSPLTLFGELYEQQNGQPMTQEQYEFVRTLAEQIWEEGL
ncbi:MAG: exonuclease SbcCD subunit D [Oscillospiraceae bacterium]|nr:exonuclease SbcCD subunit D [Oscillospiraceae bacterium]